MVTIIESSIRIRIIFDLSYVDSSLFIGLVCTKTKSAFIVVGTKIPVIMRVANNPLSASREASHTICPLSYLLF